MPDVATELTIEWALYAVECIPIGRVVGYGGLTKLMGTSAWRVRVIMASAGPGVS